MGAGREGARGALGGAREERELLRELERLAAAFLLLGPFLVALITAGGGGGRDLVVLFQLTTCITTKKDMYKCKTKMHFSTFIFIPVIKLKLKLLPKN